MARLLTDRQGRKTLVAESDEETALLEHGRRSGGRVVLQGAYYDLRGSRLLVPAGLGPGVLERLRRAFEAAARSHAEATLRRGTFRLLEG